MLAICIESSHQRGMGHFYRMLHLVKHLQAAHKPFIVLLNHDAMSEMLLQQKKIAFETVDLQDTESNWEARMIDKYRVRIWLNDRMGTSLQSARHIRQAGVRLCAIDDDGEGALLTDKHFCPGYFGTDRPDGRQVFQGLEYLILDDAISRYRRPRTKANKIAVTLGGSDTYGVTLHIVDFLKTAGLSANIIAGPAFKHVEELLIRCDENIVMQQNVESLIAEFAKYDLAITGSGVTPFEACASGLPCITVANERHEIDAGKFLDALGCTRFAGYHKMLTYDHFTVCLENVRERVAEMSRIGIAKIPLNGAENLLREVYA